MEADSAGFEVELPGQQHQVDRHIRVAAEFTRKRPVRGFTAFGENPAENPRTGRLLGDVAQIPLAVRGEEADPLLVKIADVRRLLDGVAEADPVGRNAQRQHPVQLIPGGDVEAGTEVAEQFQHLYRRVRLDGVVDFGEGEVMEQLLIFPAHDIKIDHQKGCGMLIGLLFDGQPVLFGVVVQNVNPHCNLTFRIRSNVLVTLCRSRAAGWRADFPRFCGKSRFPVSETRDFSTTHKKYPLIGVLQIMKWKNYGFFIPLSHFVFLQDSPRRKFFRK